MNYKRTAIAVVAGMVVYVVYGFLVQGLLIFNAFGPYQAVYRPAAESARYMPLGFGGVLIGIMVLVTVYAKGYEGGNGLLEGARFGMLVGVFMACACEAVNFAILNIGVKLGFYLVVSAFVQWTLVGIAIGITSKPSRGREISPPSA